MNPFKNAPVETMLIYPFERIGKHAMLITAKNDNQVNTMTASWGGFGTMWNKNVAFVVVRPQRYTKEFIDAATHFSLSFFGKGFAKELAYCGKASGRDSDKIAKCNFTLGEDKNAPYIEQAELIFVCKKIFAQPYNAESFLDPNIMEMYEKKDFHTLYIAEIECVLQKEKQA